MSKDIKRLWIAVQHDGEICRNNGKAYVYQTEKQARRYGPDARSCHKIVEFQKESVLWKQDA